MKIKPRIIDILLVEDNEADVLITKEALVQAKVLNTLHVVEDGVLAMDYLKKRGKYQKMKTPELVILDLNLPRKNGREVLAEIKLDDSLKHIPVVVLTTSSAEEDIVKSYDTHANCYVVKPLDFQNFVKVVQSIQHFWFSVVTLPPEDGFYEQKQDKGPAHRG